MKNSIEAIQLIRQIAMNWENGDLAGSIREAVAWADETEANLGMEATQGEKALLREGEALAGDLLKYTHVLINSAAVNAAEKLQNWVLEVGLSTPAGPFTSAFFLRDILMEGIDTDPAEIEAWRQRAKERLQVVTEMDAQAAQGTVGGLIKYLSDKNPSDPLGYSTWTVEDVLSRAEENEIEIGPTQAAAVLEGVTHAHDASLGINWGVIDCWIDSVKEEK